VTHAIVAGPPVVVAQVIIISDFLTVVIALIN
jgi:hypothetical protein